MGNVSVGINKSIIYWCKKIGLKYEKPIKLRINIMPANSDAEIIAYGASFPEFLRSKCTIKEAEIFSVGDKIYFRKLPPKEHDPLQNTPESANFEVSGEPTIALSVGEVRFKRIANR